MPGPACYGQGGTAPTVTDANLLLGRMPPDTRLPGDIRLDLAAAGGAIAALAGELGLGPLETAEGIIRIANQEMVRALRQVTVERGVDPRRFALLPFGGAGPMHAAEIAAELEVETLLCPRAGGTLSAFGLCVSDRRFDTARTVMLRGDEITAEAVAESVAEMSEDAAGEDRGSPDPATRTEATYALRYRGQSFEIEVDAGQAPGPEQLREAFEAEHQRRYGYHDPSGEIELVTIRVAVITPGREIDLTRRDQRLGGHTEATRKARFDGHWLDTRILRGDPIPGAQAAGPAIFEMPGSTLVLPPGWMASVDRIGTITAQRGEGQ